MKFHSIRIGKRPLMEVPAADRTVCLAAVDCFPGHTLKKRMLRSMIRLGFGIGILARLRPARPFVPPGMSASFFENWLADLRRILGQSVIYPVVVWPGNPERGRLYFYFLDREGAKLAFGKLALDEVNGQKIRNEGKVLGWFSEQAPKSFRVPELLASGSCNGADYVLTGCVPDTARAVDLSVETGMGSILVELNSEGKSPETESEPWWWQPVLEACRDYPEFESAVKSAAASGWELCRVHGDLNRTNILCDGKEIWVIDWEQSCGDGPRQVDEICLEIDRWWNQSRNPGDDDGRKCLARLLGKETAIHRSRVILALAFLHSIHFPPATALIRAWKLEFAEMMSQP